MSRLFDDASSQYLSRTAAVLTTVPITMACWFNTNDLSTDNQALIALAYSGNVNDYFLLRIQQTTGTIAAAVNAFGVGQVLAESSAGCSLNTWHHACAVFSAADARAAYLDGANKGTEGTSRTPTNTVDRTGVGGLVPLTPTQFMSGRIAEAAIWDVALSDAEIAALGKGFAPLLLRPQSLVAYWPLLGNDSPELDRWKNQYDLTVTGATKAEHSRVYYPIGLM